MHSRTHGHTTSRATWRACARSTIKTRGADEITRRLVPFRMICKLNEIHPPRAEIHRGYTYTDINSATRGPPLETVTGGGVGSSATPRHGAERIFFAAICRIKLARGAGQRRAIIQRAGGRARARVFLSPLPPLFRRLGRAAGLAARLIAKDCLLCVFRMVTLSPPLPPARFIIVTLRGDGVESSPPLLPRCIFRADARLGP